MYLKAKYIYMTSKFFKTYLTLLILSVLSNYLLAFVFPSLTGSSTTFLHTLFWSAIILLIPFTISFLIAGIYKLAKHSNYNYYWQSVWGSWAIIYITPLVGMYALQNL